MQTDSNTLAVTPPRLISSFAAGFNTVANHIYLILFPVALDLLLWLGPHMRIKTLFAPFAADLNKLMAEMSAADAAEVMKAGSEFWATFLERFNLVSMIRTYPIGITSLFSSGAPLENPFGPAARIEIGSFLGLIVVWASFALLGILGGSLYFSEIARVTTDESRTFSLRKLGWQFVQVIFLALATLVILLAFTIPTSLMLSILLMFSPGLAQIALFFLSLLLLWLLVPLVFAPHGVFLFGQNVLSAIKTSLQLVRFFLPGTGLFLLMALLIGQGLDVLWRVPDETSWMAVIGVLGHAFITTGLLSASFIYYLGGIRWMQDNLKRLSTKGVRI